MTSQSNPTNQSNPVSRHGISSITIPLEIPYAQSPPPPPFFLNSPFDLCASSSTATHCMLAKWAIPEKIQTQGGGSIEDMEFPRAGV